MPVLTGFIVPFRRIVSNVATEAGSVPVYRYLPDDVAHLPCIVVGRPTIREASQPAVMTLTLDVTLLGRRISDEDSQAELDALGDQLFEMFGGTRGLKVDDGHLHCTNLRPGTVAVAGQEMPAYIVTVSQDAISC
jgi:hypothetical protein